MLSTQRCKMAILINKQEVEPSVVRPLCSSDLRVSKSLTLQSRKELAMYPNRASVAVLVAFLMAPILAPAAETPR
jgi:hypothetical protein